MVCWTCDGVGRIRQEGEFLSSKVNPVVAVKH